MFRLKIMYLPIWILLKIIIRNLLDNAIKFSKENGRFQFIHVLHQRIFAIWLLRIQV